MVSMNVNDYVENFEKIEDAPYLANKRLLAAFRDRLDEFEKKINEVAADFKDSQKSHEKEIELLLKSDRIYEVIKAIPNEIDIKDLFIKIESAEIGKLNRHLRRIKEYLDELYSAFNY